MSTVPHPEAFDFPRRALPRVAVVIGIHALALLAFVSSDRVTHLRTPVTVMLLANIPREIVKPPPPPPPPPPRPRPRQQAQHQPRPHAWEGAAPPLRDIEAPPRTDVAATIADVPLVVPAAGGKPDGTGGAGTGKAGTGSGSGDAGAGAGAGGTPVRVRAVLDPAQCKRPRLPELVEAQRPTGHVILKVLIDVDGSVTDARLARSSGTRILDATALQSVRQCHFVAATVDKVPVPSWELFRFSWTNL